MVGRVEEQHCTMRDEPASSGEASLTGRPCADQQGQPRSEAVVRPLPDQELLEVP